MRSQGFTLLETIFAVVIIVIAFIAVFGLVNFGISSISVSKNKLTAAELAQEGLELVRWWRETGGSVGGANWAANDWTGWYVDNTALKGYFRFLINPGLPNNDPTYERCDPLVGGSPCFGWPLNTYNPASISSINDLKSFFQLRHETNKRLYNHTAGNFTNFFRIIHISSPKDSGDGDGTTNKRVITCEVFWVDRGRLNSIRAVDYLYNWLQPS